MNKVNPEYEEYKRLRDEYFKKKGIKKPKKKKSKKKKQKTVFQLRAALKAKGMPIGGKKADLIDRLKRAAAVDSYKSTKPKKTAPRKKVPAKSSYLKKGLFCPICKATVARKHVGLSTEYGYCNSCNKGFFLSEVKEQKGKKYYFCEDCNYQTTSINTYSTHLNTRKHLVNANKQEELICKMCGFRMQDNDDYLCCKSCGLTFLKEPHRITPWSKIKKEVWERDGGKCIKCGSLQDLEIKKIVSLSKGGKNIPVNLKLICNNCK